MKIVIIHSGCGNSAKILRDYLEANNHSVRIREPYKDDFSNADDWHVFSLGCSAKVYTSKTRMNTAPAVAACVDKRLSFAAFNRAKVNTVAWTTEFKNIPEKWEQVVVRNSASGRKAQDVHYFWQHELKDAPKDAQLYTECYMYGKKEYRVTVFNGQAYVYLKVEKDGEWTFTLQEQKGFDVMREHCIRAAKELSINYAGFDVLAKNKKEFVLLEANSGAIMTNELALEISAYYNELV